MPTCPWCYAELEDAPDALVEHVTFVEHRDQLTHRTVTRADAHQAAGRATGPAVERALIRFCRAKRATDPAGQTSEKEPGRSSVPAPGSRSSASGGDQR